MAFSGKVALITGASSGIGADAALHLAKLGAQVAVVGRNESRLNDVIEKIRNSNSTTPLAIVADVTKEAERIVDETIKHFGKLDILINNAGITHQHDVCSLDIRKFDEIFETNVYSVITITKLCVPYLEKTRGNIVNVSSIYGLQACQNMLSYSMSKAALDQFTKCCALDLAPKRIRVNAINPGLILTAIHGSSEVVQRRTEFCKENYPIGRIGEVSDTSTAIAFLASDQTASFLTGILLPVDGGFLTSGPGKNAKE